MIRLLTLSKIASAPIADHAIVAFSDAANSSQVASATGPTDRIGGTTGYVGASAAGVAVDIEQLGVPSVRLGGPVSAGDWLTSDANAAAVKVTAAGQRTIGRAEQPGVAGDIINYQAAPGVVGGA